MYVFIIGNAFSGCEWVAKILDAFPEIRVTSEKNPQFDLSYALATRIKDTNLVGNLLQEAYEKERAATKELIYADKSQPNIWNVIHLRQRLSNVKFIGVERDLYPNLKSMYGNTAIDSRTLRWESMPMPNNFLGISESTKNYYAPMTLLQKSTMRCLSNMRQMRFLKAFMSPSELLYLKYEDLVRNFKGEVGKIEAFLKLTAPKELPEPTKGLPNQTELFTKKELLDIQEATMVFCGKT